MVIYYHCLSVFELLVCLFSKKNVEIIQSPRSLELAASCNIADINLTVFKQPHSNGHKYLDAPPSYADVSKTVQKLPPPYPGT